MKALLFFILAGFAVCPASAQDYRNICSPGTTFFKDSQGHLKAFRRDSVYPQPLQDTLFISYRAIRPQYYINYCFDTSGGSVLGRRIYEKSDGSFCFFNFNLDTVMIKSQASLNQSWKFLSLPGNRRIEATVISLGADSIFGTTDPVKVISLQAKNSAGVNIPYYLNQVTIRLSQHYGLLKMIDVCSVGDTLSNDTTSLYLAGKSSPALGIQPFGWADVYNFDVGDIFHYQGYQRYNNMGPQWNEIKRIIGKTISANNDTLKYQVEYCRIKWFPNPPPNTETLFDTIIETYVLSVLNLDDTSLSRLPSEFHSSDLWGMKRASSYQRALNYNGRPEQEICNTEFVNYDTCWAYQFEGSYPYVYFAPGLGQSNFLYYGYDIGVYSNAETLVYFKKGNETWGTPVSTDCHTLVGVEPAPSSAERKIRIVPNPFSNRTEIEIPWLQGGEDADLTVYNDMGRKIFHQKITSSPYVFMRTNLPSGVYLLVVSSQNGRIIQTVKLLAE